MKFHHFEWGFTLLEVIMTFVLFAIVGTVAVSYFTKGITRTDIPVTQLQTDASLQLVLENMIADKTANSTFNTNLVAFGSNLGTINATQNIYGSGSNYIVTQKDFVCPSANAFVTNSNFESVFAGDHQAVDDLWSQPDLSFQFHGRELQHSRWQLTWTGSVSNRWVREKGFTLLELICVLVLLGIVAVLSTRMFFQCDPRVYAGPQFRRRRAEGAERHAAADHRFPPIWTRRFLPGRAVRLRTIRH